MRKALLVIALVAASFAGGAAVNGPGLKWVKGQISSRFHQGDAIPTLDVDDAPPKAEDEAKPESPPPDAIPSAPAPFLGANLTKATPPQPANPRPTEATPIAAEPSSAEGKAITEPPTEEPRLPVDSSPPPLTSPSDPPAMPRPKAGGWADAPGPAPARAVVPKPKTDRGQTTDAAVGVVTGPPSASSDWASLRNRMRAMGVSKYWVEGTPSGAVTFRCVVPSPGQAEINQQFEAEGDDELQAAESALRRVAVWQATEKLKD